MSSNNETIMLYHKSLPSNRESILENGLVPQIGPIYNTFYGENNMGPVVFVCDHNNYDTTYDDDIYLITLTKEEYLELEFKEDMYVIGGWYTEKQIDAKNIEIVYYGTGNSTF